MIRNALDTEWFATAKVKSSDRSQHPAVFYAEMFTLAHTTKKARDIYSLGNVSSVLFFADSYSAAPMIVDPSAHPAQPASTMFIRHFSHSIFSSSPPPHSRMVSGLLWGRRQ